MIAPAREALATSRAEAIVSSLMTNCMPVPAEGDVNSGNEALASVKLPFLSQKQRRNLRTACKSIREDEEDIDTVLNAAFTGVHIDLPSAKSMPATAEAANDELMKTMAAQEHTDAIYQKCHKEFGLGLGSALLSREEVDERLGKRELAGDYQVRH